MDSRTPPPVSSNSPRSDRTDLSGRIALVTGAASGIGAATARLLAKRGAHVIATDIRVEEGRALADLLGPRGDFRRLDVREAAQWEVAMEQLERGRGLDILVHAAGTHGLFQPDTPQDPEHCGLATWREVHRTNVEGTFLACRHAIMAMRREPGGPGRGGVIINLAAHAGRQGFPSASAYAASQAAILSHTKSVALHCASEGLGIRCNAVVLGPVLTRMWDPVLGRGPQRNRRIEAMAAEVPVGRFAKSDEVAAAIAWLASDEASFINGAEFAMDGGMGAGTLPRPLPLPQAPKEAPARGPARPWGEMPSERTPPPSTYTEEADPAAARDVPHSVRSA